MSEPIKIFIFPLPAIGHSNPILKTVDELIRTFKANVTIYSLEKFKNNIVSIGAEYRQLNDSKYEDWTNLNNNPLDLISSLFTKNYEFANNDSLRIAKDIDRDKPDLVLHDSFSFTAKFAMRILKEYYSRIDSIRGANDPNLFIPTSLPPPVIVYWTTFTNADNIYPNEFEKQYSLQLSFMDKFWLIYTLLKFSFIANKLAKKFQVTYQTPFDDLARRDPNDVNIVFTFPELHPRSHLFDKKTFFVGSCISENAHINGDIPCEDEEFKELLKDYPILNEYTRKESQEKKLIYVSLGTVYNEIRRLYSILIEAFSNFDQLSIDIDDAKIKLNSMQIIFSLGPSVYKHFDQLVKENKIKIPKIMHLAPSCPQLEILKRASLFITHSGMNSTSESIHYAVPMLCMPLNGDQPLNAYRVAIELGLGLYFDYKTVNEIDIVKGIHRILSDSSYYARCNHYSKLSRQYIGHKNAAETIIKLTNAKA